MSLIASGGLRIADRPRHAILVLAAQKLPANQKDRMLIANTGPKMASKDRRA
jgi:hypothetical protein